MSYFSYRTELKYNLSGSFHCPPVGNFLCEPPQYHDLGFLGDMKYSYASQPDGELFKDRVRITSIFASPMPSIGLAHGKALGNSSLVIRESALRERRNGRKRGGDSVVGGGIGNGADK